MSTQNDIIHLYSAIQGFSNFPARDPPSIVIKFGDPPVCSYFFFYNKSRVKTFELIFKSNKLHHCNRLSLRWSDHMTIMLRTSESIKCGFFSSELVIADFRSSCKSCRFSMSFRRNIFGFVRVLFS